MSALARFRQGQRVRVVREQTGLAGREGAVKRLRHADSAAWVRMDLRVPDELRVFPIGDLRERDVLLYPEECEAVQL